MKNRRQTATSRWIRGAQKSPCSLSGQPRGIVSSHKLAASREKKLEQKNPRFSATHLTFGKEWESDEDYKPHAEGKKNFPGKGFVPKKGREISRQGTLLNVLRRFEGAIAKIRKRLKKI